MDMLRVLNLSVTSEIRILMFEDKDILYVLTYWLSSSLRSRWFFRMLFGISRWLSHLPFFHISGPHFKLENFQWNDKILMSHAESDVLFELWKDKLALSWGVPSIQHSVKHSHLYIYSTWQRGVRPCLGLSEVKLLEAQEIKEFVTEII